MKERTSIIPVELDDGTIIKVEAELLGTDEDVNLKMIQFNDVAQIIEKIARTVISPLKKVSPQKIQIELGVSIGIESGQLTALLTKGTGSANFKIALEWSETKP